MSMTDARAVPVSSSNAQALAIFERALYQLQTYRGDPVATIDAALAEDPDFVIGHILRAAVHITLWERSVVPEVEAV